MLTLIIVAAVGAIVALGDTLFPQKSFAAGIVDVVPTVLHLIGLPAAGFDGRVLIEAMSRGASPGESRRLIHEVEAGAKIRRLDRQRTGSTYYLDGGFGA